MTVIQEAPVLHQDLARWAGLGYQLEVKQMLETLPFVDRVIDFAEHESFKEALVRPDLRLWLSNGLSVFVDAKLDPEGRGTVAVRRKNIDHYIEHADRHGVAGLFLCASAPGLGSHHAVPRDDFKNMLSAVPCQLKGGAGLSYQYRHRPSIESALRSLL